MHDACTSDLEIRFQPHPEALRTIPRPALVMEALRILISALCIAPLPCNTRRASCRSQRRWLFEMRWNDTSKHTQIDQLRKTLPAMLEEARCFALSALRWPSERTSKADTAGTQPACNTLSLQPRRTLPVSRAPHQERHASLCTFDKIERFSTSIRGHRHRRTTPSTNPQGCARRATWPPPAPSSQECASRHPSWMW